MFEILAAAAAVAPVAKAWERQEEKQDVRAGND